MKAKLQMVFDAVNIIILGMMYAFLFYIILCVMKVM